MKRRHLEEARHRYGPPTSNLDLSLSKSFRMGATRRVEVRLDALDALNHTQYSGVNST